MSAPLDLAGKRTGMLVAVRSVGHRGNSRAHFWECRCDCGKTAHVRANYLRSGKTTSCGCQKRLGHKPTHGHARGRQTPTYLAWLGLRSRCSNPKNIRWPEYGGRGITVCERWKESFEHFLADMGEKPSRAHQIDRINNDGNYEPSNCRWTTRIEQMNNTSANVRVVFQGRVQTIAQWARELGIAANTIAVRLRIGWSPERALTAPACNGRLVTIDGVSKTMSDWARAHGLKRGTISWRHRHGLRGRDLIAKVSSERS